MKLTKENPLFPGFFADPDMLKWKDTYYIYPTTDGNEKWRQTEFHVFSSQNLAEWKDEGVVLDVASDAVPWSVHSAWAPAIIASLKNRKEINIISPIIALQNPQKIMKVSTDIEERSAWIFWNLMSRD